MGALDAELRRGKGAKSEGFPIIKQHPEWIQRQREDIEFQRRLGIPEILQTIGDELVLSRVVQNARVADSGTYATVDRPGGHILRINSIPSTVKGVLYAERIEVNTVREDGMPIGFRVSNCPNIRIPRPTDPNWTHDLEEDIQNVLNNTTQEQPRAEPIPITVFEHFERVV